MPSHRLIRLLAVIVLAAGILLTHEYRDELDVARIEQWLADYGYAAPLLFILLYMLGAVFFLPGTVLSLAGGALFGPLWGSLYNLSGATLGAVMGFLIARNLGADWLDNQTNGRLQRLKKGVEAEGWRFVAFVRLVPIFPFNFLNYALGLTRIRLPAYVITTGICVIPGVITYSYLGYVGREALIGGESVLKKGVVALSLLVLMYILPRLVMLTLLALQPQLAQRFRKSLASHGYANSGRRWNKVFRRPRGDL